MSQIYYANYGEAVAVRNAISLQLQRILKREKKCYRCLFMAGKISKLPFLGYWLSDDTKGTK